MPKHNCSYPKSELPCPHILKKFLQRYTQQELADTYEVNEKTLRRHLKPSDKPKQRRGRKRKFNQDDLKSLCSLAITLEAITQEILAQEFSCSQSTISLTLKRAGISYKKISYQSTEQLRKENQKKIEEFIDITLPDLLQTGANIFFLDESSFRLNMAPRRGYYLKSSRLFRQRPGNKGKNYSLILLAQITNGEKIIH
jgi:transposase